MPIETVENPEDHNSPIVVHAMDPDNIEFTMCTWAIEEFWGEENRCDGFGYKTVSKAITCEICIRAIESRMGAFKKVRGKWRQISER